MGFAFARASLLGLLFILLSRGSIAFSNERIYLPTLNSAGPVGFRTMAFTDKTRLDDFAPTPQYREVVVSLFYPMGIRKDKEKVQSQSATNYLPYSTARFYDAQLMALGLPPGSAERIFTHSQTNGPFFPTSRQPLPLLVFSPGYGATFHLYTAMLQEIARKGYAVAAIDHPYDADFVEFPNGKTVRGANRTTDHNLTEFLTPRLRDISLVLNELARPAPSHPIPVNTHNVIAFGHSLGGDTAVEVMLHDSRVQGGLNFDGNFNGKLNSSDCAISRPVLLIRTKAVSNKINWNDVWEKFVGWKVELTVSNTTHNSFSDLPLLADALGLRSVLHRMGNITMGDLGGLKGLDIMSSYVTAFANFIFVGDDRGSLKSKVGKSFAEVEFVRKGGPQRDADISSY